MGSAFSALAGYLSEQQTRVREIESRIRDHKAVLRSPTLAPRWKAAHETMLEVEESRLRFEIETLRILERKAAAS